MRTLLFALLLPLMSYGQDTTIKRLNTVTVTSKRPLLQMDIDKTIVNVNAMISSASSNTLEVLEKTPGVTVNAAGDITLNGRGAMVLIDGRQTYMSAQDLANYLKSLPGGLLDKIELIDNPSARYDASGNAIINIRLKKNKTAGFTGSVASGLSQGKYLRGDHSLNLNYRYNKINIFGNIGFNHEKTYNLDHYRTLFYNTGDTLLLTNNQHYNNKGISTMLGIDYAASENTTYGMQISLYNNKRTGDFTADGIEAENMTHSTNISNDTKTNIAANLNFLHKFGNTGRELSVDANYLKYYGDEDQHLTDFSYQLPSDMHIYSIKADYLHPLKNGKIEAGLKSSVTDNDNMSLIDNSLSNHFKYHENINAVYISAAKNYNRLGVQLGLRAEQTISHGEQLVTDSAFRKNYTQLFPNLFLTYKLDTVSANSIAFMITRRINRPNYQLLNPFLFYKDQYSYTAGNPLLIPQYQFRYELKFQHKQLWRVALSYNKFTNVIFQTTNVVDNILITKPENVTQGFMILLNNGFSLSPFSWWNLNTDILLSRMWLDGQAYGERLNPKTYVARINLMNQLQLSKTWSAEFSGYYASADLNGQAYTDAMFRANCGLQKRVLKGKGSIRFSADDIFHSWIYHNRSTGLKQTSYLLIRESDNQRIRLAFTYNFGKETFTRKSKHRDNALDEEKGRL